MSYSKRNSKDPVRIASIKPEVDRAASSESSNIASSKFVHLYFCQIEVVLKRVEETKRYQLLINIVLNTSIGSTSISWNELKLH